MKATGFIEKVCYLYSFFTFSYLCLFLSLPPPPSLSLSCSRLGKTDNYNSPNSQKSRLMSVSLALLKCPPSSLNWRMMFGHGGKQLTAREKLNAVLSSIGPQSLDCRQKYRSGISREFTRSM